MFQSPGEASEDFAATGQAVVGIDEIWNSQNRVDPRFARGCHPIDPEISMSTGDGELVKADSPVRLKAHPACHVEPTSKEAIRGRNAGRKTSRETVDLCAETMCPWRSFNRSADRRGSLQGEPRHASELRKIRCIDGETSVYIAQSGSTYETHLYGGRFEFK